KEGVRIDVYASLDVRIESDRGRIHEQIDTLGDLILAFPSREGTDRSGTIPDQVNERPTPIGARFTMVTAIVQATTPTYHAVPGSESITASAPSGRAEGMSRADASPARAATIAVSRWHGRGRRSLTTSARLFPLALRRGSRAIRPIHPSRSDPAPGS